MAEEFVRRFVPELGIHVTTRVSRRAMKPATTTRPAPTTATASRSGVPPPPDLAAAIKESRSSVPTQRVLAQYEARVVAASRGVNVNGVPNPPSLRDLLRRK
jgi:hypothetical protein